MEELKKNGKTNDAVLQQKAAQKYKYTGWGDFVKKASKSLGTNDWNEVSREKSRELAKKLALHYKKKREAEKDKK